jgi:hypothetical protein
VHSVALRRKPTGLHEPGTMLTDLAVTGDPQCPAADRGRESAAAEFSGGGKRCTRYYVGWLAAVDAVALGFSFGVDVRRGTQCGTPSSMIAYQSCRGASLLW